MKALRIGTRGSPLALWQARAVDAAIRQHGGPACEIVTIRTTGDRLTRAVLSEVGGKAVFVKEIEEALLDGSVDLAVHSAKDLPGALPDGLCLAGALPREDPRDALVLPADRPEDAESAGALIARLGPTPRVGTGSVRRVAQLARRFPTTRFEQIRGNVDTRLRQLDAHDYDAIVLAAAGLRRLGLAHRISVPVSPDDCLPAPGQGIVAIEIRTNDTVTRERLAPVTDETAWAALRAERAVLEGLGGDCHVPLGALAEIDGARIRLRGLVAAIDGTQEVTGTRDGPVDHASRIGGQLAADLAAAGATALIEAARPPTDDPRR